MSVTPMRPCGVCRRPVPDGNCPTHPRRGGYRPERRSVRDRVYGPAWVRVRDTALRLAGHRCAYCSRSAATGDHVVPHSRGGARWDLRNVVAACAGCNTSKGDRTLQEWVHSGLAPEPAIRLLAQRILDGLPV
jgi:5-methylcytosine-specific restriction endonuclease McrA